MWVKRKAEEQKKAEEYTAKLKKKTSALFSLATGIIITAVFTFTYSRLASIQLGGIFIVPRNEIINQFRLALIIGIIIGGMVYFLCISSNNVRKSTLVCTVCNQVKNDDGIYTCNCGGQFEDITRMKWVD